MPESGRAVRCDCGLLLAERMTLGGREVYLIRQGRNRWLAAELLEADCPRCRRTQHRASGTAGPRPSPDREPGC
jgi:hypothetical protein